MKTTSMILAAVAGLAVSILLVAGATTALIRGVRGRSPILPLIFGVVTTVVCAGAARRPRR